MDIGRGRAWMPAAAAVAAVGALAVIGGIGTRADADLPDKSADEVLALVAAQDEASYSGRFEVSLALGLPQLPGLEHGEAGHGGHPGPYGGSPERGADEGSATLAESLSLLSGTHEARVFVDGEDRARVQVFDGTEERNIVRHGDEVWTYDSAENTATHAVLPDPAGDDSAPDAGHLGGASTDGTMTPDELAEELLAEMDPSTQVTVEQDTRVADREAYTLRLDPRTEDTLVEDVTLAVDAATGTVLRVQVHAVGQEDPAVSIGFTSFSPETPDASLFEFTPPAGAEVEEIAPPEGTGGTPVPEGDRPDEGAVDLRAVHGSGWDAVVVLPADEVPEELASSPLIEQYATTTEAGRVLSTPLATVLLADDGRVLVGAVPVDRLLDVAGTG